MREKKKKKKIQASPSAVSGASPGSAFSAGGIFAGSAKCGFASIGQSSSYSSFTESFSSGKKALLATALSSNIRSTNCTSFLIGE